MVSVIVVIIVIFVIAVEASHAHLVKESHRLFLSQQGRCRRLLLPQTLLLLRPKLILVRCYRGVVWIERHTNPALRSHRAYL